LGSGPWRPDPEERNRVIVEHDPQLLVERYRVGEPLGAGGMGTVFAGYDLRLDRAVAIKLLRPEFARDPELRRRFEREARAAARVAHHHAVGVYDTGEDADHETFIVMELLSGRTFAHELADGPVDEPRLREVADGVLAALAAAHAEGLVHRDVKPGNILLADDGIVKVGDFGIATSLDTGETTTGVALGTPAYTAPERLRGLPATERSDLYSLGVVLYEAATGVRPFTGDGASAVAEAVVAGDHVLLAELRPDLSPAFVAVVERALATNPDDRFADAAGMQAALHSPPAAPTAPTVPLVSAEPTATLPVPRRGQPRARPSGQAHGQARGEPVESHRRLDRRALVVAGAFVVAVVVVILLLVVPGGDGPAGTPPASTTPATAAPVATTPVPAPLARALDRLDQATQP
jgi:serine/threonine-protein kinase